MNQSEAAAIVASVRREWPGRIRATLEPCGDARERERLSRHPGGYRPRPGEACRVGLTLLAGGALRHFSLLYPSGYPKALDAWAIWLLTDAQIAALSLPADDDDDEEGDGGDEEEEAVSA